MFTTIRALLKDESGATAIEYALIIAGVSIVLLGAFSGLTGGVEAAVTRVTEILNGTGAGTPTPTPP
ncbi:MAG TPA: Flp family type IVb pilin [Azospirillum sp.]|nr:Flp family type IVb pilin [Azospirillum sp.]